MRFRRPQEEEPEVNLIPLIDVLLIVLIFLAVSTSYARYAELKIELPTAEANKANQRPNEILVAITADGRYAIDKQLLPYADPSVFAQQLREAAKGRENPIIVINADAQAPHQAVISVREAARLAGLPRISFATQRPAAGSGN
jgi:biopolymer transport protein ExbD